MATNGKKLQELILHELEEIKNELKEVRQTDIPNLKIDVAVVKQQSNTSAKIITAVGGLIAIATSSAIAWFKK